MKLRYQVLFLVGLAACGPDWEAEARTLRAELNALKKKHADTEAHLRELEEENEAMLTRLRAAGENISSLSEARASLARDLQDARSREEQQKARLEALRKMVSQFRDMINSGQLRVRIVRGKMVVQLPEGVLFDSGSADLKENGKGTLQQVAQVLSQIPNREFLVAGHTDNVPIRSRRFPSNWELSAARGVVVTRFLAGNGMPETRLGAAGYADTQPFASNDTPEDRALNRRIEIVLMPNLEELPDLSSLEGELKSGSNQK